MNESLTEHCVAKRRMHDTVGQVAVLVVVVRSKIVPSERETSLALIHNCRLGMVSANCQQVSSEAANSEIMVAVL